MSDIGEMTETRKAILKKKYEVEMSRLSIKMSELEIRKLEKEEELEIVEKKMLEVQQFIKDKKKELGGLYV